MIQFTVFRCTKRDKELKSKNTTRKSTCIGCHLFLQKKKRDEEGTSLSAFIIVYVLPQKETPIANKETSCV
jgi:hypothetical protein